VASFSQAATSKRLTVAAEDDQVTILTDPVLLGRVLTNLLKNALEATPEDGEVRLSAGIRGEDIEFQVWNAGAIPEVVQLQIFTRSFTTKGAGRGIGTYSVKLFAEEYLHGRVTFASSDSDGTTFTVLLPWAKHTSHPPIWGSFSRAPAATA
jgi:signal transduction histidine kinase